jgi:hypothetical protein
MNIFSKFFHKNQARLKVLLPSEEWIEVPESGKSYRFARKDHVHEELLEIYLILYKKGLVPKPSLDGLIELVQGEGKKRNLKDLQRIESGTCAFGTYASNIFFTPKGMYLKIWYLSNGKDFIYATYGTYIRPNGHLDWDLKDIVLRATINYS